MPPTYDEWPPRAGLSSHIVPRNSVILSISSSTTIDAPAELIFQVLCNSTDYPSWNTFCPSITIHTQPPSIPEAEQNLIHKDTLMTFGVIMDPSKPNNKTDTQLRVTDISTPATPSSYLSEDNLEQDGSFEPDLSKVWRIAWTTCGSFVARGLRTERFSEVIELEGGERCLYRTWECQGGVLARTVKWLYEKKLGERFDDWCRDLKKECEKRAQAETGSREN